MPMNDFCGSSPVLLAARPLSARSLLRQTLAMRIAAVGLALALGTGLDGAAASGPASAPLPTPPSTDKQLIEQLIGPSDVPGDPASGNDADQTVSERKQDRKGKAALESSSLPGEDAKRPPGAQTSVPESAPPGNMARELGPAGKSEEENPLLDISRSMLQVSNLLRAGNSGPQTQQSQRQIADRLARLLQQLQQQSQQQGSQSSASRQRGAQQSGANTNNDRLAASQAQSAKQNPQGAGNRAAAGQAQAADIQTLLNSFWGELPERVRDQVTEPLAEEFLPKYRTLIEQYYRRLAEMREHRP